MYHTQSCKIKHETSNVNYFWQYVLITKICVCFQLECESVSVKWKQLLALSAFLVPCGCFLHITTSVKICSINSEDYTTYRPNGNNVSKTQLGGRLNIIRFTFHGDSPFTDINCHPLSSSSARQSARQLSVISDSLRLTVVAPVSHSHYNVYDRLIYTAVTVLRCPKPRQGSAPAPLSDFCLCP